MESVRTVIGKAAETANNVVQGTPETPEEAEARKNRESIVQGLLYGRVVWADSFLQDFWFYMKQTHVFLSIFLCHDLHPFSRFERFVTFLASLAASFGLSMLFLDKSGEKLDSDMAAAAGLAASIVMSIMYAITVTAFTCSCVQEGGCIGGCMGGSVRSRVESFGRCIGCTNVVISLLVLAGGLLHGKEHKLPISLGFEAWAYAQVYSIALAVATGLLLFLFAYYGLRCCCCCACCCPGQAGPDGSKPSSAYPYGVEYPTDKALLWGGDHCSCMSADEESGFDGEQA